MLRRRTLHSSNDKNTMLLMHGGLLSDESGNGASITTYNVVANSSGGKFGYGYLYFNGSYIRLDSFQLSSSQPFTVDFWIKFVQSSTDTNALVDTYQGSDVGGTTLRRDCYSGSNNWDITTVNRSDDALYSQTVDYSNYNHVAFVFDLQKFKCYLNGQLKLSTTNINSNEMQRIVVGWDLPQMQSSWRTTAYISELRISNIVRWNEDFTPPSKTY